MSRYFVISPNVANNGNTDEYLKKMFEGHSIMIGWGPDKSLGQLFANMRKGERASSFQCPIASEYYSKARRSQCLPISGELVKT